MDYIPQNIIKHSKNAYLYLQQRDNECHIIPWINLSILKQHREKALKSENLKVKISDLQTFEKKGCLAATFAAGKAWQQAMNTLSTNDGPFAALQIDNFENGIVLGNAYTADGDNYFDAADSAVEVIKRISAMPHTGIDASYLAPKNFSSTITQYFVEELKEKIPENMLKTLPIFYDANKGMIGYVTEDSKFHAFEQLQEKTVLPDGFQAIHFGIESKEKQKPQSLQCIVPNELVEHFGLNGGVYTTPESFGYANGYCKSFLPNESYTKTYYVSSLYNLMLTALGVDLDGNEISLGHDKYEAYTDFKNVLAINAANPWNGKSNLTFNKNNFFEYQLSKVFKEDPKLMIEAEKVCSCYFKGMSYYREMSQLFDEKGDSYSDRVCKYLAKDHLMLAYYFSANLRYLWAAAKSNMGMVQSRVTAWGNRCRRLRQCDLPRGNTLALLPRGKTH